MLTLDVHSVEYAQVPGYGPDHLLARLRRGDLRDAFPALDAGSASPPGASPFTDRAALARRLVAFNESVGNPLPQSAVDAIERDGAFVIAGQQPGLLMGPMYTLFKAITAIGVARQLQPHVGAPVIPAFWIAGEDHDLLEVNHCTIGGRRFTARHDELHASGPLPAVANITLEPFKHDLIAFLQQELPNRPHKPWVLEMVESVSFENYTTMFAQLLTKILGAGEIVLIDPMAIRELTSPVLAAALERSVAIQSAFTAGQQRLADAGYAAPLDRVAIFELTDTARLACAWGPDGLAMRDGTLPYDQAADLVRAEPRRFSPNAALRPIVQDAALPTLATVAGPTEAQYLWQIDPLYEALGVQRSKIASRVSATFVDANTADRARRMGFDLPAIFDAVSADDAYDQQRSTIETDDLDRVQTLGRDLIDAVEQASTERHHRLAARARRSIRHQVDRLLANLSDERLARDGRGRAQRRRLLEAIWPGGGLQERVASPFEWLAACGPDFVSSVMRELDATALCHHVVQVEQDVT